MRTITALAAPVVEIVSALPPIASVSRNSPGGNVASGDFSKISLFRRVDGRTRILLATANGPTTPCENSYPLDDMDGSGILKLLPHPISQAMGCPAQPPATR